jgi:aminomethyltransferase
MSDLKRTPLYEFHKRHGGRIVPFAGWELPVQYSGILEEHRAVRRTAGLFDVSHMGELAFRGPGARDCLQHLLSNDMGRLRNGAAIYSLMCMPEGGCVDDVIAYQTGEDEFLVCVNASNADKDYEWASSHCTGFDCRIENKSADYAQLALQGPAAWAVLEAAGSTVKAGDLKRFHAADASIAGWPVLLSRTGYTGEDGAELYCAPDDAEALADALFEGRAPTGHVLAGLARATPAMVPGCPSTATRSGPRLALQAGLGWAVKLDKEADFVGREALRAEAAQARAEARPLHARRPAHRTRRVTRSLTAPGSGRTRVCSGTFSPMTECPIGSDRVDSAARHRRTVRGLPWHEGPALRLKAAAAQTSEKCDKRQRQMAVEGGTRRARIATCRSRSSMLAFNSPCTCHIPHITFHCHRPHTAKSYSG